MKHYIFVLLACALAHPLAAKERRALAPKPTPAPLLSSELDGADLSFLKSAAESQVAQVALAQLVKSQAQESEIRTIAASLSADGKKEREALAKLAGEKGWPVPAELKTSAESKSLTKTLGKLKGPKFDKTAMDLMSKLESERAEAFQAGAASRDPAVRDFAETHLPAVQESLLLIAKLGGTTQPKVAAPIVEPPVGQ